MADADENWAHPVSGAEDDPDLLVLVQERRGRSGGLGRVVEGPDEPAFCDSHAGAVEEDRHVGREAAAARVGVALAVEADHGPIVPELSYRLKHGGAFTETEERGDVGNFDWTDGAGDFDDAFFDSVIDDRGGENFLAVLGKGGVSAADETREGSEGRDTNFLTEGELGCCPGFDEVGPIGGGFAAGHE